jgi:hypothetical protein
MTNKLSFSGLYHRLLSSKRENLFFYLFCFIYVSFLIYLSNKLTIWDDESCSLSTTANHLSKVLHLSYSFEGQPPVYFILLAIWRKINDGILFSRLLSISFTLLSACVLDKTVKLVFKDFYSKWVIVLFLLNPYTVWASLEIRLYSQLIFLSLSAIYLWYLIYFCNRTKLKILFVLIGIFGVYTQYYFTFLIVTLSVTLFFYKGWRVFFNYCLWALIIAIVFLPNLLFITDQYVMHQNPLGKERWFIQVGYIIYSPIQFLFAPREMHLGKVGYVLFTLIIVFFISLYFLNLYKKFKKFRSDEIIATVKIFISITILLLIFIIIFITFNLLYLLHYLTITFPFYCILLTSLCIYNNKTRNIVYGLLAAYYIFIIVITYHCPYVKRLDSRSVASYVQLIESQNEPILFRDKSILLTVSPYYTGNNPLISIPDKPFDYNFYRTEIKDTIELRSLINGGIRGSRSFLFISWDDGYVCKDDLTNEKLDSYFKNNFEIEKDTVFKGKKDIDFLRVRRLSKKLF